MRLGSGPQVDGCGFYKVMVSLSDVKSTLEAAADAKDRPHHVAAFVAWILRDDVALRQLVDRASSLQGQSFLPDHVAVFGYGRAAELLSPPETSRINDELVHLGGRTFFAPNRARQFEVDGIALLGVALATSENIEQNAWIKDLLLRSSHEVVGDEWQLGLARAARLRIGERDLTISPPDLASALALRGIGALNDDDLRRGGQLAITLKGHVNGPERDAARLSVFNAVLERQAAIRLGSASHEDLVRLLRNIPKSLRLWRYENSPRTPNSIATRWEIENEYHVQALLWVILAPLFPDLDEEENLASLGQKNPRVDLVIPSLRTIIEVKFVRSTGQAAWAKVIEEVAADTGLYLSGSKDYDNIIAFVWDDTAHTEQHEELRNGLEKLDGVSAAVIISRPGKMVRQKIIATDAPRKPKVLRRDR